MTKIGGSGAGSISQRHRSANPNPHQNVMDPQHRLKEAQTFCCRLIWVPTSSLPQLSQHLPYFFRRLSSLCVAGRARICQLTKEGAGLSNGRLWASCSIIFTLKYWIASLRSLLLGIRLCYRISYPGVQNRHSYLMSDERFDIQQKCQ